MSRYTQYIGLNKYAEEYVKNAISAEKYEMAKGIADEPVYGHIYHMPVPEGPNKSFTLTETVQANPWSSGPMFFTHLVGKLVKECGQELEMGPYFSWMVDPSLENEYDNATGRYCI